MADRSHAALASTAQLCSTTNTAHGYTPTYIITRLGNHRLWSAVGICRHIRLVGGLFDGSWFDIQVLSLTKDDPTKDY